MATNPDSIIIQWGRVPCMNRNSNITGYMVRYSTGGGSTVDASVSGTEKSDRTYTASWLAPNISYSIQVAAVTSTGAIGPFSATITEKTSPPESELSLLCMVASLFVRVYVPSGVNEFRPPHFFILFFFTYRCFCFQWCCHSEPWFCSLGQYW